MTISSKNIFSLVALLFWSVASFAAVDHAEIEAAVKAASASPKNQVLNRNAADLLKDDGQFREAIRYYLKGGNPGNLGMAECYFYLYDFEKASEHLDKYLEKRTKAEAEKDKEFSLGDDSEPSDWTDYLRARIELGSSMLDRVEKIQVIDSINVPAEQFFKFIKLASSAGRLVDESAVEQIVSQDFLEANGISGLWSPAYSSESGEDVIWYGSTTHGDSKMFESFRLSDGSWDAPVPLFDYESIFGNKDGSWVSYPFLMNDGVTLYFAADGDESLGELDIFISRRDEDGFLQPSNIGMPYNSPYNDYMYAIDEATGAGWWVSDRNQIKDSVTIYTFIPQDLRINYPVETPGLIDFAKMSSVASTWEPGKDYSSLRKRIASLADYGTDSSNKSDWRLALPDGRIIESLADFNNPAAAEMMEQYLTELNAFTNLSNRLLEMRSAYSKGDRDVEHEILSAESTVADRRKELRRLKNSVVNLEMRQTN